MFKKKLIHREYFNDIIDLQNDDNTYQYVLIDDLKNAEVQKININILTLEDKLIDRKVEEITFLSKIFIYAKLDRNYVRKRYFDVEYVERLERKTIVKIDKKRYVAVNDYYDILMIIKTLGFKEVKSKTFANLTKVRKYDEETKTIEYMSGEIMQIDKPFDYIWNLKNSNNKKKF